MLDRIATDIWSNVETVFLSGGYETAAIALIIAVIAAFVMSGYGQIINTTVGALVVFGLAQVVYGVVTSGPDVSAESSIGNSWDAFMAVTMGAFLVYFIAFFVVISVFYIIRSAIQR